MNLKPVAGAIAVLAALVMPGCADIPRDTVPLQLAKAGDTLKTEVDQGGEAQLYLDTGYLATNAYNISAFDPGDPLPDVMVDRVSLTEAGIYQAMNLMTKDTDLTVSIMGGADAAARYGAVSVMNVRGKLSSVLERLSQSMGFFYSVHGKHLLIEPERQFFIEVPPALNDDTAAGMANTLQALGARDIYLDRSNRTLVLRVNRTGYERIARYLKKVREERAMIVYEVSIFQVDLKDQNDTGVQWNKLGWAANGMIPASPTVGSGVGAGTTGGTTGSGGAAADVAGALARNLVASQATGYGLGMVLNSSKFSIDSLVTFLQTQGTVKSLSSPRIAMLAGTKGSIRVGNTLTYVSKIGSNTTVGLSQISTETKDLRTGLDLALFGEVHDNTVYSRVSLSLSELVRMTSSVTLGNEQKLPETAEREIKTEIRARPGDMILLGGVTVDRSSFDVNRGLMINGSSKQSARSELVVALKPKLVHFQAHEQAGESRVLGEGRPTSAVLAPVSAGDARSAAVDAVAKSAAVPAAISKSESQGGVTAQVVAAASAAKPPSSPSPASANGGAESAQKVPSSTLKDSPRGNEHAGASDRPRAASLGPSLKRSKKAVPKALSVASPAMALTTGASVSLEQKSEPAPEVRQPAVEAVAAAVTSATPVKQESERPRTKVRPKASGKGGKSVSVSAGVAPATRESTAPAQPAADDAAVREKALAALDALASRRARDSAVAQGPETSGAHAAVAGGVTAEVSTKPETPSAPMGADASPSEKTDKEPVAAEDSK